MSDTLERAVLGCVLVDQSCFVAVSQFVNHESFTDPRHRIIWVAISEVRERGDAVDLVSVGQRLELKRWIDQAGGHLYLSGLVDDIPDVANADTYAKSLQEEVARRKLIAAADRISEEAKTSDVDDAISRAHEALLRLSRDVGPSGPLRLSAAASEADQRATVGLANPGAYRGIPTGLARLDELTGGLHSPDLVVVAARPGVGKTAMALNWALNQALAGRSIAFFSLEMSSLQLAQRLQSMLSHVSATLVRSGSMTRDERAAMYLASKLMKDLQLWIDDTPAITVHQILARCDKLRQVVGLDAVYVDYLQIMGSKGSSESRNQEVASFSRGMKAMAKELRVPVVALSQLSRRIEMRDDHTPSLSDLRESGSIEQDADIVMFLSANKERTSCQVDVAKHRNGPLGSFRVGWRPQWTSFANLLPA